MKLVKQDQFASVNGGLAPLPFIAAVAIVDLFLIGVTVGAKEEFESQQASCPKPSID